jgi:protein-S-isoprenylcysteine O-methyltransferase Ste14
MFLAAVPMGIISIAIYRGKTDLIHDYHQTKVTDKAAYGKAFGKAMFVVSLAILLSGIVGLLGNAEKTAMIAVAVLFVGLAIGIACIISVQKKFNNGLV